MNIKMNLKIIIAISILLITGCAELEKNTESASAAIDKIFDKITNHDSKELALKEKRRLEQEKRKLEREKERELEREQGLKNDTSGKWSWEEKLENWPKNFESLELEHNKLAKQRGYKKAGWLTDLREFPEKNILYFSSINRWERTNEDEFGYIFFNKPRFGAKIAIKKFDHNTRDIIYDNITYFSGKFIRYLAPENGAFVYLGNEQFVGNAGQVFLIAVYQKWK